VGGQVRMSSFGRLVRVVVACVVAGVLAAGCAGSEASDNAPQPPSATGPRTLQNCLVATSWGVATLHLDWEVPILEREIPAAGAQYTEADARGSSENQVAQIDEFVRTGARVLIVERTGESAAYLPAVQRAIKAGVAVISIGQPIVHEPVLYVDWDLAEQGRQEAKAMLAIKPKGTYAIFKGDPTRTIVEPTSNPESDLISRGIREILQPAVDRGDIKIVATVETPNWDPTLAQQEMTAILSQNGGSVDAVLAASDSLADGVEEALQGAGLTGKVAVAAGGSHGFYLSTTSLLKVAWGDRTVEVWGDMGQLAHAVAEAAVALCLDPDITKVAGSASVTWPGRDPMRAMLLAPVPITNDNIGIVFQADARWWEWICGSGPDRPEPPPACQPGPVASPSG
jgi:D-xylose transport system substrate-binding protein